MENSKKENPQKNETLNLSGYGKVDNDETIKIPKGTYNPDDESITICNEKKKIMVL